MHTSPLKYIQALCNTNKPTVIHTSQLQNIQVNCNAYSLNMLTVYPKAVKKRQLVKGFKCGHQTIILAFIVT